MGTGYTGAMTTTPTPARTEDTLLEVDSRKRLALGRLAHHDRYLVHEESDGTLILTPAEVSFVRARYITGPYEMSEITHWSEPCNITSPDAERKNWLANLGRTKPAAMAMSENRLQPASRAKACPALQETAWPGLGR